MDMLKFVGDVPLYVEVNTPIIILYLHKNK
jgi:hypothetical protein